MSYNNNQRHRPGIGSDQPHHRGGGNDNRYGGRGGGNFDGDRRNDDRGDNRFEDRRGGRGGFGGGGRGGFGGGGRGGRGGFERPIGTFNMGNHQSTSWNGYPLLDTGDSTIPPWFPNFFRARPPLEYVEPCDGIVPKNYHIKGY